MRVRFGSERIITVDVSFVGNILNRLALLAQPLPEVVQIAVQRRIWERTDWRSGSMRLLSLICKAGRLNRNQENVLKKSHSPMKSTRCCNDRHARSRTITAQFEGWSELSY